MITTKEILALSPGPELDAAVHQHVYQATGLAPAYSQQDTEGLKLLEKHALFVGRIDAQHPAYSPEKPWCAGTLAHSTQAAGDITTLRVVSSTRLSALCKAALIVATQPTGAKPPPLPSRAPKPTPATKEPAPVATPAAQRQPKKAAPAPAKAAKQPTPTRPPVKPHPAQPGQPRVFLNRANLPPMPKRKPFAMPDLVR
jgi:hypothetical protein